MKLRVCALILAGGACLTAPYVVHAESFDLGGFESLFGEPVTTSVTGMPMRESDVPINMTIVTAEDIQRSGSKNIPEILRRLVGIDVLQWTANYYDVGIRGYNQIYNPRLLVMVNGRQIYLDLYGMIAWQSVPVQLEEIRQIEVVRGPNTALFGFNAVSGVVNIVTYSPLYDHVSGVTATVGSHGLAEAGGYATVTDQEKYGIRLSAGRAHLADNHDIDDPVDRPFEIEPKRSNVFIDSLLTLGERTKLAIELTQADWDHNEFEPSNNFTASSYHADSIRARLFHDSDYGIWKLNAYKNWLRGRVDGPGVRLASGSIFSGRVETSVLSIENQSVPLPGHNLRLQGAYRRNNGSDNFSGGTDLGYDVFSIGGAWNWQVFDRLSTIVSARYDAFELDLGGDPNFPYQEGDYRQKYRELSYNAAAIFKATREDTIRISAARGIQTPSYYELGLAVPPQPLFGGVLIRGNPEVSPTTLDTFEINYERKIESLHGAFKAAAFYQRFEDLKSLPGSGVGALSLVNGVPVFAARNVGDSKGWGAELDWDGEFGDHWRYGLNYTFLDIEDELDVNQNSIDYGVGYEDTSPQHMVNARLGVDWRNWQADLFAHWQSDRDMFSSPSGVSLQMAEIDGYFNIDARLAYRVMDKLDLSLSGFNLLGETESSTGLDIEPSVFLKAQMRLN